MRGIRLCGEVLSGNGRTRFIESLWQTPRGHWFLHGTGQADTLYGRWTPDGERIAGKAIRPVTPEVAERWLDELAQTPGDPLAKRTQ